MEINKRLHHLRNPYYDQITLATSPIVNMHENFEFQAITLYVWYLKAYGSKRNIRLVG